MTCDYGQEADVRCPECREELRVELTVEKRRMTFGGIETDVIEVSSGYVSHTCDPSAKADSAASGR